MKRNNYYYSSVVLIFLVFIMSCSTKANYVLDQNMEDISVEKISGGYRIMPKCYEMEKGLIFYPGGLVKPDAYIPLAIKIARKSNISVFIREMPFDLAVLNGNGANKFLKDYDYIHKWYIVGHSLGGAMASSYIYKNPEVFKGLILLAAYPIDKQPIKDLDIPVLSIVGSEDGLVDSHEIDASRLLLPPDTKFITINGGNHAQFGSYGKQKGDNDGKITELEQQTITVDYIDSLLNN